MNKNKIFGLLAVVLLLVGAFFIFSYVSNLVEGNNIDRADRDGADLDNNELVNIINGEDLVIAVGGLSAYDFIRSDMYDFANTAYDKYKSVNKPNIGFKINSINQENGTINFNGRFGATRNDIRVVVKTLNKGRVNISITDKKTGLNIDSSLPSNSPRNQFIGTLPIETEGFVIEYLEERDSFTVNVFNDSQNYEKAIELIKTGLGVESLDKETVVRYGAGDIPFDNGF